MILDAYLGQDNGPAPLLEDRLREATLSQQPCPYPKDRLDPALVTGLILCGMGGPDGPEAVRAVPAATCSATR